MQRSLSEGQDGSKFGERPQQHRVNWEICDRTPHAVVGVALELRDIVELSGDTMCDRNPHSHSGKYKTAYNEGDQDDGQHLNKSFVRTNRVVELEPLFVG